MASTIYTDGIIITMEDQLYAEAIFVENGIIQAVGTKEEIMAMKEADTQEVCLKGQTLMPAFIDSHSHITAYAQTLSLVSLENARNFQDIAQSIEMFRQEQNIQPGEWINGFGYDQNFLEEGKHPDRAFLDLVAPHNPVIIAHASGHMGVMNTLALQATEFKDNMPDPEGGRIGREKDGVTLNGYLEETAFTVMAAQRMPKPTMEQLCRQLENVQNQYFQYGITTIQDGLTRDTEWSVLCEAAKRGLFKADVVCYIDLKNCANIFKEHASLTQYQKSFPHFRIGGYKIFLDGSPQGRTAWLTEPYVPADGQEPDYCGYPIYTDNEVTDFVKQAMQDGCQLLAHCNGDAAAQQFIHAVQDAEEETESLVSGAKLAQEIRPVMIHAQLVRHDQLRKMAKQGMIASMFVAHTHYWGDVHRRNLGEERASRISPAHAALREGVVVTFHQDSPVLPPNMLDAVWCAVNRITKSGEVLGKEERVTPLEALKAVTINAAYQYFEEAVKGSIAPGKLADFVVLDQNPLAIEPEKLRDICVLKTIKEDEIVYTRQ